MKQHGAAEEETIKEFRRQIANAWMDINEECLEPTEVAKPLLMRSLNFSRVMDVLYKDEDCYTHSVGKTKEYIAALHLNLVS